MLLDVLERIKAGDSSLAYRRSCREGICGSDAMNINGKNGPAWLTNMKELSEHIVLRPLPGLPVIRDLIVDMTQFFYQYHSVMPYLVNSNPPPEKERLQSPEERDQLDGCMNAFSAHAARQRVRRTGEILTGSSAPAGPTHATKPPHNASTI